MVQKVRPTKRGRDLDNTKLSMDAHVRLEGSGFAVDVFNSKIKNPNKAHITSEEFPLSRKGKREGTKFLKGNLFDVEIV